MSNRLTPEEERVFEMARLFFVHRTVENTKHLVKSIKDWIRSDNAEGEQA